MVFPGRSWPGFPGAPWPEFPVPFLLCALIQGGVQELPLVVCYLRFLVACSLSFRFLFAPFLNSKGAQKLILAVHGLCFLVVRGLVYVFRVLPSSTQGRHRSFFWSPVACDSCLAVTCVSGFLLFCSLSQRNPKAFPWSPVA